jgi:hypothetical protein
VFDGLRHNKDIQNLKILSIRFLIWLHQLWENHQLQIEDLFENH